MQFLQPTSLYSRSCPLAVSLLLKAGWDFHYHFHKCCHPWADKFQALKRLQASAGHRLELVFETGSTAAAVSSDDEAHPPEERETTDNATPESSTNEHRSGGGEKAKGGAQLGTRRDGEGASGSPTSSAEDGSTASEPPSTDNAETTPPPQQLLQSEDEVPLPRPHPQDTCWEDAREYFRQTTKADEVKLNFAFGGNIPDSILAEYCCALSWEPLCGWKPDYGWVRPMINDPIAATSIEGERWLPSSPATTNDTARAVVANASNYSHVHELKISSDYVRCCFPQLPQMARTPLWMLRRREKAVLSYTSLWWWESCSSSRASWCRMACQRCGL